jgi:hypothetical protein
VWLTLALLPMSLGAHLVALLVFLGYSSLTKSPPKPVPPEKRPVSLRRLDSRQWAANRGARTAQPLEHPTPDPRGQVVDVAPGNNRRVEDAKYLATTDNAVAKETRAKEQVQKWSVATPKSSPTPEAMPSAKGVMPSSSAPPPSGINLSESMLGRRLPVPSLLPSAVSGSNQPDQPQAPVGTEAGSQAQGKDTSEGGGAPNDALENVAEGDGTFLNTKEWRYASFFNRVKQAVSGKWDPNGRLRQRPDTTSSGARPRRCCVQPLKLVRKWPRSWYSSSLSATTRPSACCADATIRACEVSVKRSSRSRKITNSVRSVS